MDSWSVSEAETLDEDISDFHVSRGDQGPYVLEVQELLNDLFGAQLVKDGVFGPLTEEAVRDFQRVNHLTVDGIVGPETTAALQDTASLPIGAVAPSMPTKVGKAKGKGLLVGAGVSGLAGAIAVGVGVKKHKKAAIAIGALGLIGGAVMGVIHVAR